MTEPVEVQRYMWTPEGMVDINLEPNYSYGWVRWKDYIDRLRRVERELKRTQLALSDAVDYANVCKAAAMLPWKPGDMRTPDSFLQPKRQQISEEEENKRD